MAPPVIKVFALDDCDWWAGASIEECVAAGQAECGTECYADPDCYAELDDAALQRMKYREEDGTERTFAEELARMVADPSQKFPSFFASTEW